MEGLSRTYLLRLVTIIDFSNHPWSVRQAASALYFSLTIMAMKMVGDCLNPLKRERCRLSIPATYSRRRFLSAFNSEVLALRYPALWTFEKIVSDECFAFCGYEILGTLGEHIYIHLWSKPRGYYALCQIPPVLRANRLSFQSMDARLFHGFLVLLIESWAICEEGGVNQDIDIRHEIEWFWYRKVCTVCPDEHVIC